VVQKSSQIVLSADFPPCNGMALHEIKPKEGQKVQLLKELLKLMLKVPKTMFPISVIFFSIPPPPIWE
jgi:hypothetical protein